MYLDQLLYKHLVNRRGCNTLDHLLAFIIRALFCREIVDLDIVESWPRAEISLEADSADSFFRRSGWWVKYVALGPYCCEKLLVVQATSYNSGLVALNLQISLGFNLVF